MDKNEELKEWLLSVSTPEELEEIKRLEEKKKKKQQLTDIEEKTLENANYNKKILELLNIILSNVKKPADTSTMEAIQKMSEEMSNRFGMLVDMSKVQPPDILSVAVYKGMIDQLSAVKQSIDGKPVPVWKWPQYASVSVRNKNFANINPSIAPFGIDDYDDIKLQDYDGNNNPHTVRYYNPSGQTAQLNLSYDGSGNLIDAQRVPPSP